MNEEDRERERDGENCDGLCRERPPDIYSLKERICTFLLVQREKERDRSRVRDQECLCMFVSASVCIRLSVYAC